MNRAFCFVPAHFVVTLHAPTVADTKITKLTKNTKKKTAKKNTKKETVFLSFFVSSFFVPLVLFVFFVIGRRPVQRNSEVR